VSDSPPPRPARTLKLTVAYDGTRLVGWQRQAAGDSVQALLEDTLARFEGAPVVVHGAGRTDAGVHALGQVASVRVTCEHDTATLLRALNAALPMDVRMVSVEDAALDFHARFDARGKTYRYQIRNGPITSPFERAFVWHVPQPLDQAAMDEAARALEGTHDFAAFQSVGSETPDAVRTLFESRVSLEPGMPPPLLSAAGLGEAGLVVYRVRGSGFLRHLVRTIAGTLVEVGRGWRSPGSMKDLLAGRDRSHAGATAPPHGLFLVGVDYD
jgi:tRNA pseudouridine38-40 synthase